MCWACNPTCGKCRPRRQCAVMCPQCGKPSFFDRTAMLQGDPVACPHCGCDVTEIVHVEPALCGKVSLWCGFPCKRKDEPYDEGYRCQYLTSCDPQEE